MATQQDLEKRILELEKWKTEKEKQQVKFPVDINSLKVLGRYLVEKINLVKQNVLGLVLPLDHTTIASYTSATASARSHIAAISVGDETLQNQGGDTSSLNTQIYLEDQPDTTSLQSFLYGFRKPLYVNRTDDTISVTSGAATLTDSSKNWTTNELAGAIVHVFDSSGVLQFARQIASNTATVITIDSTWPATVSGGTYVVSMPIYFGASAYPWRMGYFGGNDISSGGTGAQRQVLRFGYGSTTGTETRGLFLGTGSPESVVTSNVGSLYLRTDGGVSDTLYVKTSGTGNTGWTAK